MADTSYFTEAALEGSRRAATTKRDTDLATNAYARFLAQQRGERTVSDLGDAQYKQFQTVSSPWGKRGMLNSGQYVAGLQKAAMDRFNKMNDTRMGVQGELRTYDDKAAGISAQYDREIADMELQIRLQQQQAAAQLQAMKG
jgi:hypothetical protein